MHGSYRSMISFADTRWKLIFISISYKKRKFGFKDNLWNLITDFNARKYYSITFVQRLKSVSWISKIVWQFDFIIFSLHQIHFINQVRLLNELRQRGLRNYFLSHTIDVDEMQQMTLLKIIHDFPHLQQKLTKWKVTALTSSCGTVTQ